MDRRKTSVQPIRVIALHHQGSSLSYRANIPLVEQVIPEAVQPVVCYWGDGKVVRHHGWMSPTRLGEIIATTIIRCHLQLVASVHLQPGKIYLIPRSGAEIDQGQMRRTIRCLAGGFYLVDQ